MKWFARCIGVIRRANKNPVLPEVDLSKCPPAPEMKPCKKTSKKQLKNSAKKGGLPINAGKAPFIACGSAASSISLEKKTKDTCKQKSATLLKTRI